LEPLLSLAVAHTLSEEIGVAAKVLNGRERDRIDAILDRSETGPPEIWRSGYDDLETLEALILLGGGIAWLPDFLIADAAEAGKLVRVLPQWRPNKEQLGTCYFVYPSRQYALPKVEGFIQMALELVQRDGFTMRGSDVRN
jgi:DNA-binding transcriptional LysR family regulator